ncbi:hypothetical protein J19TS2_03120 [Cohnella xylanilytica]|uniref:Uncharacterized protein n=1 Tax=Cohnella xylanilytica TaxID=557555 RepID=A0A841U517_9BACL|nr:hypothetical protein [Cohnella xylanilytica]MBB6693120.1 hypothetical protein [Cohnella xylanilytica]GIO10757.1 hypothetical protein J19TS2_03120 [Cohnella xylanilytica]
MGRFLDLRSSMNSSITGAPNTPLTTTPVLFGVIGLQTDNVANKVITLTGMVGISDPIVGNTFTIQILRGTTTYSPANVIYTATLGVRVSLFSDIYTFTAQDLLAPAAAETIYSAFIFGGPLIVLSGVRTGPEVFWGIASQGAP